MKVFISWSGTRSRKVALIFHDWLPSVIQSIAPFVSSEDIDKGARWNTDIARELKESTFGIICVTKENLLAPWLNFEAGALSKTMDNTYVAPFLFDVKPSDLKNSPISQFQATSFNKEDLKRLLGTLNRAAENSLSDQQLAKTFEVWYPTLDKSLNDLHLEPTENSEDNLETVESDVLEEILEMSRNTQRLLGNVDARIYKNNEQFQKMVEEVMSKSYRVLDVDAMHYSCRMSSVIAEEIFYMLRSEKDFDNIMCYDLMVILSLYRDDFPWLYDVASELERIIESDIPHESKVKIIDRYKRILNFIVDHPKTRELFRYNKETLMILRELSMKLIDELTYKIL